MYMKRCSRGFFFCKLFYRNYTVQNPTGLHAIEMKPLGRAFVWSSLYLFFGILQNLEVL